MPTKTGAQVQHDRDSREATEGEQPVILHRTLRVPEPLWTEALEAAKELGTTVSDLQRDALKRAVRRAQKARGEQQTG